MTNRGYNSVVLILGLLAGPQGAFGAWLDPRFDLPGANGAIHSLVEFRGTLYAVGGFTRISGVDARGVARWTGSRWEAIQLGLNASVISAVTTDEAIYLAVYRNQMNQPAGLVRWDGQSWTALGTPPGYRDALGVPMIAEGRDIYVEAFPDTSTGGPYWNKALAKWDGTNWSILATTSNIGGSGLHGLTFAQGSIFGSGALYDSGNPQMGLNLGRLVSPNWFPVGGGVDQGFTVFDIASDGTALLIQGGFRTVGSQPAEGFAVWDGAQWQAPNSASRGGARVVALTSNPSEVLASEVLSTNGPFGEQLIHQHVVRYVGTNRTIVARGDASGMRLMRRTTNGVYCTGMFRAVGGVATGNIGLWNGTNWTGVGRGSFNGLSSQATCLAVAGTNVFAGGEFEFAGDAESKHIARWDGRRWHSLGNGIDGTVLQLAVKGDELYVIGSFTSAGESAATNIAKWDGNGWSSVGSGLGGTPKAITATGRGVYVAHTMNHTNFVLSRWDDTNWNAVASGAFEYGRINTIAALGESMVIGGTFDRINGSEMNNIARWDGNQWHSLGGGLTGEREWIPNDYPFAEVHALLADGDKLYVGGSFTNAGSIAAKNVARWDGTHWSPLGSGIPGFGSCLFGDCVYPVTSLASVEGKLFAGGGFTTDFSSSQGFLASWDGMTWSNVVDGDWSSDMGQPYHYPSSLHVWALGSQGSILYLAGNFATLGKVPSYGFAAWREDRPPILRAKFRDGQLVLSWPRIFQTAVIESTASLIESDWAPVTSAIVINGTATNDVEVQLVPETSPAFYRLNWQ